MFSSDRKEIRVFLLHPLLHIQGVKAALKVRQSKKGNTLIHSPSVTMILVSLANLQLEFTSSCASCSRRVLWYAARTWSSAKLSSSRRIIYVTQVSSTSRTYQYNIESHVNFESIPMAFGGTTFAVSSLAQFHWNISWWERNRVQAAW